MELEEASTHKSAVTHTCTVFLCSWPWPFDPKINGFPGLIVEHLFVKEGYPNCIGLLWDIVRINRQTDRQTPVEKLYPRDRRDQRG